MIRAFGWIRDVQPVGGMEDYHIYLLPISCGFRRMEAEDKMGYAVNRPNGRRDYQLLYIQSGAVDFTVDGVDFAAAAGEMVMIRPRVAHSYRYDCRQMCAVSWLHCTGQCTQTLLESAFDRKRPVLRVGASKKLAGLYQSIMLEMQRKDAEYTGMATALTLQLIYYMLRKHTVHAEETLHRQDARIDESVSLMYKNYHQQWTNEQLAAQVNLSPSRYIHLFSQIHNTSPLKFLNTIRLNMAKELLSTRTISVSEVAEMCGFQSQQYFCRIFRKQTGMTPTQYRDQEE